MQVTIAQYDVFMDFRSKGFDDNIMGTFFDEDDGRLGFHFLHNLVEDHLVDHALGTHPYVVYSSDGGRSWTDPVRKTLPCVRDLKRESLIWSPLIRTQQGSVLYTGSHQWREGDRVSQELAQGEFRQLYARRPKGVSENDMTVETWPPGKFFNEGFLEGGMQLACGRLIYTIWGALQRGENWRCGVLISDDDGQTWRFRQVGYEADLSIRDARERPAGFNEQTLFNMQDGRLVSIIRGRAALGRGVPGGSNLDTWFFRSESNDGGENWSAPQPTDLPGTGATLGQGLTLPDGSLLLGCRIPYSRTYYQLPEMELFGLHLARSFDAGKTWQTEAFVQHDPEGNPFSTHHTAMNGVFRQVGPQAYDYVFGYFGLNSDPLKPHLQRILRMTIQVAY